MGENSRSGEKERLKDLKYSTYENPVRLAKVLLKPAAIDYVQFVIGPRSWGHAISVLINLFKA